LKLHNPVIVVHGGAGDWPLKLHRPALSGVRTAADLGFKVRRDNESALDAVEAAVVSMEDNPIFNAGTGSTLNLLGQIETDAAIMDGRTLRGGARGAVVIPNLAQRQGSPAGPRSAAVAAP